MCLQEFLNPFCEKVENAFSQPNAGIQEIAGNLQLKQKINVSLKLFCCVFVQHKVFNLCLDSESLKHVSYRICVLVFQSEWE